MIRALVAAILCISVPVSAAAFDPRLHRRPLAGSPTEVMVLGTPHLSGLPDKFNPATLSLLIDRLAGWKPDRILIESLSGRQCDMLHRYAAMDPSSAADYCMDPSAAAAAAAASGLDVPSALAAIDRTLAQWPVAPSAQDRRRLALLFLAVGERASALVQWLHLPPAERRAADGLTPELMQFLDATITRKNENYLVAAPLAVRLGHQRLWPIDDHSVNIVVETPTADDIQVMRRLWDTPAGKARHEGADKATNAAITPAGTLAMYRYFNDPAEAARTFASDFGAAMADPSPGLFGRHYLAGWEARNLRMAANIREVSATIPGQRLLVLTGASHKGYLDAYLQMMHDVNIADLSSVLHP